MIDSSLTERVQPNLGRTLLAIWENLFTIAGLALMGKYPPAHTSPQDPP